jgi:hypothetical protein
MMSMVVRERIVPVCSTLGNDVGCACALDTVGVDVRTPNLVFPHCWCVCEVATSTADAHGR